MRKGAQRLARREQRHHLHSTSGRATEIRNRVWLGRSRGTSKDNLMPHYHDAVIEERAAAMDRLIRKYFDGCNEADIDKMLSCFTPDAVHYFPPGMYEGPFRGAKTIAEKWRTAVNTLGSYW